MSEQAAAVPELKQPPKIIVQTADVRIVEYTLAAGARHPWHFHSEVSDRVYCLEGLVGIETKSPERKVVLKPGEACETPARTVHHVSNAGSGTSRYLLVQALGKYDYNRTD